MSKIERGEKKKERKNSQKKEKKERDPDQTRITGARAQCSVNVERSAIRTAAHA